MFFIINSWLHKVKETKKNLRVSYLLILLVIDLAKENIRRTQPVFSSPYTLPWTMSPLPWHQLPFHTNSSPFCISSSEHCTDYKIHTFNCLPNICTYLSLSTSYSLYPKQNKTKELGFLFPTLFIFLCFHSQHMVVVSNTAYI